MADRAVAVSGNEPPGGRVLPWRILAALSSLSPAGSLGGKAALNLIYSPRPHSQIELFWRKTGRLGTVPAEAERLLSSTGLKTYRIQSHQALTRLRVETGKEACWLNLVAEPCAPREPPVRKRANGIHLWVDTPREILAQFICALATYTPGATEVEAVRRLLALSASLDLALDDARYRDSGYSVLQLAWNLREFALRPILQPIPDTDSTGEDLLRFAAALARRIVAACFMSQLPF